MLLRQPQHLDENHYESISWTAATIISVVNGRKLMNKSWKTCFQKLICMNLLKLTLENMGHCITAKK